MNLFVCHKLRPGGLPCARHCGSTRRVQILSAGVLAAWDKNLARKHKISVQGIKPQRHVQPIRTTGPFYSSEILSLTLPF